jgi:fibronectin-binding autotransporter adhesin
LDAANNELVTITNSAFGTSASTGNFAGGPGGSNDLGAGGAIYVDDDSYPAVMLTGSVFVGNVAQGGSGAFGGAFESDLGTATFSGNTFSGNEAISSSDAEGGAVYANDSITSTNDTFTTNVADASSAPLNASSNGFGGAVVMDADSSWTGSTFSGNRALAGGGSSEAYGGAFYAYCCNFTGTQLSVASNSASDAGLYADGGGLYVASDANSAVILSATQFTGNSASNTAGEAYGGSLEVDYAGLSFSGVTFTSNTATGAAGAYGGGFEYFAGSTGTASALRNPSPQAVRRAAALAADKRRHAQDRARRLAFRRAHVPMHRLRRPATHRIASSVRKPAQAPSPSPSSGNSSTFNGNTASVTGSGGNAYGGGADLSGTITFTGASFTSNRAMAVSGSSGYGGGVSFSGASACLALGFSGATINGNSAATQGGGIWSGPGCNTSITNSTISNNTAGTDGGGIESLGTLSQSGNTFSANSPNDIATGAL